MDAENKRRLRRTLQILLILTLCFIWGNSLLGREDSAALSRGVLRWLLDHGFPIRNEHLLRKLAHFGEFGLLGMELSGLAFLRAGFRRRAALQSALSALLAASADETLQRFSGRSAQLTDVLLDFSGALTGILFLSLLLILIGKYQNNDA